jgi:hypothetical protein
MIQEDVMDRKTSTSTSLGPAKWDLHPSQLNATEPGSLSTQARACVSSTRSTISPRSKSECVFITRFPWTAARFAEKA